MERRNTHREAPLPPVTSVNRGVSRAASRTRTAERGLLSAGTAVLQVCAHSWSPPGRPGCLGALCGSAVITHPGKGQEWRPTFLLVIMPQNKD